MAPSDLKSLLPLENRREFLASKLALGFALALCPVSGQTITTDSVGLNAGDVKINVPGATLPGYRACPAKGGNFPIMLVVEEIFGVNENLKDICRRFAKLGYCAVAPELFARQGDVSKMTDPQQILNTVVSKVPDTQVMADLDATAEWARANSRGNQNRVAITGFDWGGRIVWLYCALNEKVAAGVSFYGKLEGGATPLTPKQPLDYAGAIQAPVLGFYGGKDTGIPMESVEKMKLSLKVVESPAGIIVYPNAQHGFLADGRPTYSKEDADDAWKKVAVWFKKNGV